MKKILLIIVIVLCVLGIIGGTIFFITRNSDKTDTPINDTHIEPLAEEQFKEIENKYLNADNVFSIEDSYTISERGTTVVGKMTSGTFDVSSIVEYVDCYGNIKKAPLESITTFQSGSNNSITPNDNQSSILLGGVKKDDISLTTILFKNETYNGISITFTDYSNSNNLKNMADFLDSTHNFDLKIEDEIIRPEFVSYMYDPVGFLKLAVILENGQRYDLHTPVSIEGFDIVGEIKDLYL